MTRKIFAISIAAACSLSAGTQTDISVNFSNDLTAAKVNTVSYLITSNTTNKITGNDFIDDKQGDEYTLYIKGGECLDKDCTTNFSLAIPNQYSIDKVSLFDDETNKPIETKWDNTDNVYESSFVGKKVYALLRLTPKKESTRQETAALNPSSKQGEIYSQLDKSVGNDKNVQVKQEGNLVKVVVPSDDLFESGQAKIKTNGLKFVSKIKETLANNEYAEIRIEGHADNVPINTKGYKSNWELSTARATDVVKYLVSQGVDPKRIAAVGYGDSRPIADNKTVDGRMKNRRVEITIVSEKEGK